VRRAGVPYRDTIAREPGEALESHKTCVPRRDTSARRHSGSLGRIIRDGCLSKGHHTVAARTLRRGGVSLIGTL
jgi:hypothetical protein